MPPVEEDLALCRLYGARPLALALNTAGRDAAAAAEAVAELEARCELPAVDPVRDGPKRLVEVVARFLEEQRSSRTC